MADSGVDLRNADLIVGTSAGARVAVQLASGVDLDESFLQQVNAPSPAPEPAPAVNFTEWRKEILRAKESCGSPAEFLRLIGARVLSDAPRPASQRRQYVAALLPCHVWPAREILIVAVEAETGERRAFDRNSGIDLIDAVAASGAVVGISPAVIFRDRHYFDGGFYSTDNADLALGFDRVLVAALRAGVPPLSAVPLETAVRKLRAGGARVEVIHPDEATESAFAAVGRNLLDPAVRGPAARAGREQGRRIAKERMASWWA